MDYFCEWGGDIVLDSYGGIQPATGWDEARQQIERLLFTTGQITLPNGQITNPEYIWEPQFGVGIRAYIGQLRTAGALQTIQSLCQAGIVQNPAVASTPAPIISITPVLMGLELYVDIFLANGTQGTIALTTAAGE